MKKVLEKFNPGDFSFVGFQHLNILNVRSRQRIPQNCRTAVVIIFPYYNKSAWGGNISAYCSVADYHIVVMEQLKSIISQLQEAYPRNSFVPFVDSSPIDEVDMAVKAGLGVKGQNSLLITEKWGSFVFIGEILTDLEWETTLCDYTYCAGCGLCRKNCPGGAIHKVTAEQPAQTDGEQASQHNGTATDAEFSAEYHSCPQPAEKYAVNCENCASFISQKKQELTEQQTAILKKAETIFGCDICQKVCPHNRAILNGTAETANQSNLFSGDILNTVTADNVVQIYKSRPFGFRGLKVLERNIEIYNR